MSVVEFSSCSLITSPSGVLHFIFIYTFLFFYVTCVTHPTFVSWMSSNIFGRHLVVRKPIENAYANFFIVACKKLELFLLKKKP